MKTFDERASARAEAVSRLKEAARKTADLPCGPAMAALFLKTAWMGSLDPDMLARVPCDEVITLADAVLGESDRGTVTHPEENQ